MTQYERTIRYQRLTDRAELSPDDRTLIAAAEEACKRSYAPYSGFHVGAAARLRSGAIVSSSNQESEVFPSGMCAERILLYHIQSEYPGEQVLAIGVTARQHGAILAEEVYPCGGCAQLFRDTEKRQKQPIRILMSGLKACTIVESAQALLPFGFELNSKA